MHELSVALRIVETLNQELAREFVEAKNGNGQVVSSVALEIGKLSGLVPEALEFSWNMAAEGSLLAGSTLDIRLIDVSGYCTHCQAERILVNMQSMRCPDCRMPITEITGGNELEILTVEIDNV